MAPSVPRPRPVSIVLFSSASSMLAGLATAKGWDFTGSLFCMHLCLGQPSVFAFSASCFSILRELMAGSRARPSPLAFCFATWLTVERTQQPNAKRQHAAHPCTHGNEIARSREQERGAASQTRALPGAVRPSHQPTFADLRTRRGHTRQAQASAVIARRPARQ